MGRKIRIKANAIELTAELNDTRTADAISEALPIKAKVSRWGQEIYLSTPVNLELEKGQDVVNMGDLGYWPPGKAFCIFFGPTPASLGDEIRPASAVTVFGKVVGEAMILDKIAQGTEITIEGE
ncbi:cyclophilin-like fold protein [Chloroflexota bacterium]